MIDTTPNELTTGANAAPDCKAQVPGLPDRAPTSPEDLWLAHREELQRFAGDWARRRRFRTADICLFEQAADVSAWQAAQRWRPDAGRPFLHYALVCVAGGLRNEARSLIGRRGGPQFVSIETIGADGRAFDPEDVRGIAAARHAEARAEVEVLLTEIPADDARLIIHHMAGVSQRELGAVYCISGSRVGQRLARALDRLRAAGRRLSYV
jgi:RNA polymerase sigma factor (sigma-70 family)